jgi:hypothetical protein
MCACATAATRNVAANTATTPVYRSSRGHRLPTPRRPARLVSPCRLPGPPRLAQPSRPSLTSRSCHLEVPTGAISRRQPVPGTNNTFPGEQAPVLASTDHRAALPRGWLRKSTGRGASVSAGEPTPHDHARCGRHVRCCGRCGGHHRRAPVVFNESVADAQRVYLYRWQSVCRRRYARSDHHHFAA